MSSQAVVELPDFDTGEYLGSEFHMAGGDAVLTIDIANRPRVTITFHRLRWHRFTSMYACPAELIKGAYFCVAEVTGSAELAAHIAADSATIKPYKELHHYRIFLDETGCHEALAESVRAS